MTTNVLDANVAALIDHLNTFIDPNLVAIDQELLDGRTDPVVSAQWEALNADYRALRAAIETDHDEALRLLDAIEDATGDLHAVSDAAGRNRGIGLTCAMRPSPAHPDGIGAFEAFQMVPLPEMGTGIV
jgi:hypothetical protein